MDRTRSRLRPVTVGGGVGLVLGILVLGPALAPGYTLHYDLVFVPDLPLSARTLGTDGTVPRAVPNDLLVALASLVLPGWVVQKLVLLGSFVLGGAGAGRLATTRMGAVATATWWSWNPWVGERLGIGHWGYLVGFALLPWVLAAAARLRSSGKGVAALVATLTASALAGSTPGVIATILAAVVVLLPGGPGRPRPRHLAIVVGTALLANASWWYPFLRSASHAADPDGARAFAAAGDTPFGALGSLALGGGLWHEGTWFVERTTWPVAAGALLAVLALLLLCLGRRHWWADPLSRGATVGGVLGLVLAGLGALPAGHLLLEAVVTTVPGGGILRDGQKFAALWVLLLAVATARVVDRIRVQRLPVVLLAVAVAWPVATLPTLAWGHSGTWGSVSWPDEFETVTDRLSTSTESVAVFPWSTYRRYDWNDDRVVLDPWNRLLPQRVVTDDRLALRGEPTVAGEGPSAAAVTASLAAGTDLADVLRQEGVRWVVVQTDQPAPARSVPDLPGEPALVTGDLEVHDLGRSNATTTSSGPLAAAGLVGTLIAVLVSVGLGVRSRRGETRRTPV
ncbi:hypothetical protein [Janibacter cremeus]|uniref:Uncharacterized protein n=1 Tax=Janibacter cremeus TaxID=1285192 RepID=A0A852VY76_9MICO|nr:hypothetical protein [Janibacter cremeus]NYF99603.1 hypothetical protein [Janibacter cremeus]